VTLANPVSQCFEFSICHYKTRYRLEDAFAKREHFTVGSIPSIYRTEVVCCQLCPLQLSLTSRHLHIVRDCLHASSMILFISESQT